MSAIAENSHPAEPAAAPRAPRSVAFSIVFGAFLFAMALVPRATDLRSAYMIDESLWLDRSERFVDSVTHAHFGEAFTTGHPGVTTMWIAGLAQKTLPADATREDRYERARLALAIVASILIVVLWLVARGLLGSLAAGVAGVMVAFDPFLLAHNRVVHLDGFATLTGLISLVALFRWRSEKIGVSAAFAGLALLTRTLTAVPLLIAAVWILRRAGWRRISAWFGIAAGVFVLGWPLVWVRPWKAVWLLGWGAARAASAESDAGRFFLGRNVNPGPLYYPVVFALRSSIVTLPGTVATAVWAFLKRHDDERARTVLFFLAFALGSVVLLTVANKKSDRYVLPSLVASDVAIAIAFAAVLRNRMRALAPAMVAAVALHAGPALWIHPFELASFNWAAGGPHAAEHAFAIGRGEGLETAARDLSKLLPGATIATSRITQFEEFYDGISVRIDDPRIETAGFVLFYISSVQTGKFPDVYALYKDQKPFYTLRINGLDYVQVWHR